MENIKISGTIMLDYPTGSIKTGSLPGFSLVKYGFDFARKGFLLIIGMGVMDE